MAHTQELLYAYATTSTQLQKRSKGKRKVIIVSNTFKEVRKLPEATFWEAAEDNEMASLIKHEVYDLIPITSVPARSKLIGSR